MTVDGKMVTAQQRDFFHLTSKPKKENHKIKRIFSYEYFFIPFEVSPINTLFYW